jgi:hypothetical protein
MAGEFDRNIAADAQQTPQEGVCGYVTLVAWNDGLEQFHGAWWRMSV